MNSHRVNRCLSPYREKAREVRTSASEIHGARTTDSGNGWTMNELAKSTGAQSTRADTYGMNSHRIDRCLSPDREKARDLRTSAAEIHGARTEDSGGRRTPSITDVPSGVATNEPLHRWDPLVLKRQLVSQVVRAETARQSQRRCPIIPNKSENLLDGTW
jgi:hypothetical protein